MATIQGYILGQVYGGPDSPGLQCVRCQISNTLLQSGDVIQFGDFYPVGGTGGPTGGNFQSYIPQGADLIDAILRVSEGATSVHLEVGYAAADGANGTTNNVADVNATYFLTSTAFAASAIARANGPVSVVKLQRPTNPTVTLVSGNLGTEAVVEVDVFYYYRGNEGATSVEDA